MRVNKKETDRGKTPPGSRGDMTAQAINFYKFLRKPLPDKKAMYFMENLTLEEAIEKYKLKSFEFGRWVTFDDRLDYLKTSIMAFEDLNKVLDFRFYNIGLHRLSISIGARGTSFPAHFEPAYDSINITRYHKNLYDFFGNKLNATKVEKILHSGGIGGLAHEYGHFLDYFFGSYIEQNKNERALSGGRTIRTEPKKRTGKLAKQMEKVINAIIWEKLPTTTSDGKYTKLYTYLRNKFYPKGEYWLRRNELFARAFELYVNNVLLSKNIINNALTSPSSYKSRVYNHGDLTNKVFYEIEKLISMFRQDVNK